MALAGKFSEKTRIINDIYSKMAPDEKKMMLRLLVKNDMKLYFEAIWDEQKFLEEETGIDGAYLEETTECANTSKKAYGFDQINDDKAEKWSGLEPNLAGKVSKEAENAYYFDEKPSKNDKNDRYDGFLGYVNDSPEDHEKELEIDKNDLIEIKNDEKTTLEPGNFIEKIDIGGDKNDKKC